MSSWLGRNNRHMVFELAVLEINKLELVWSLVSSSLVTLPLSVSVEFEILNPFVSPAEFQSPQFRIPVYYSLLPLSASCSFTLQESASKQKQWRWKINCSDKIKPYRKVSINSTIFFAKKDTKSFRLFRIPDAHNHIFIPEDDKHQTQTHQLTKKSRKIIIQDHLLYTPETILFITYHKTKRKLYKDTYLTALVTRNYEPKGF